jgi:hypothetical protein
MLAPPETLDTGFRQETVRSFSGGGAELTLKASDVPPGLFVSIRAHPVFRITRLEYPSMNTAANKRGLTVGADFRHEPSMGECYFDIAIWAVAKESK